MKASYMEAVLLSRFRLDHFEDGLGIGRGKSNMLPTRFANSP